MLTFREWIRMAFAMCIWWVGYDSTEWLCCRNTDGLPMPHIKEHHAISAGRRFRHQTEYDYLCHLQAVVSSDQTQFWVGRKNIDRTVYNNSIILDWHIITRWAGWNSYEIQPTWLYLNTNTRDDEETTCRHLTPRCGSIAIGLNSGTSWEDFAVER